MGTLTAIQTADIQKLPGSTTAWVFPGQGSQYKGFGAELMNLYPDRCAIADAILGYSVRDLCLNNPDGRLQKTQYAQPAIYIINALNYEALHQEAPPSFLAGHSLGEYNALLAAGCFNFETGLRIVRHRGALMGKSVGGGMVAVIDLEVDQVEDILKSYGLDEIDIANYNARNQVVLSGPQETLSAAIEALKTMGGRCVPLDVSAAFHSRYMTEAAEAFSDYLHSFTFEAPHLPVISNVTAKLYSKETISDLLAKQINSPVRWRESMHYMYRQGVRELREVGSNRILKKLWQTACEEAPVLAIGEPSKEQGTKAPPEELGSPAFCCDYGIRYAYLAGSMFKGISSVALVVRMARAGLMGFLGTGGLSLEEVDAALHEIKRVLGPSARYGANLLREVDDPEAEEAMVSLYLRHDVRFVEAAAFIKLTPAIVHYRFKGAYWDEDGRPRTVRHVITKLSRPEVASAFMAPVPDMLVDALIQEGKLTSTEGDIARRLPVSQDICVESDSAGHTDGGVALTLIPIMIRLRDEVMQTCCYLDRIRVGASGGLGTPDAVAAAFILGAEFVVTGSVNQCSPEAGTSACVKDLLANLDVQDTTYAPAGDMFELGAKVQAVRKGTLFSARANKLYQLYRQYDSLDAIDSQTRHTIEKVYFKRSIEQVWQDTKAYFLRKGWQDEIKRAKHSPKHKMALVFRWYFAHSIQSALAGDSSERANFQIHCGPAMGAFNRFVKGTDLEDWHNRHVDIIADWLMHGAAEILNR